MRFLEKFVSLYDVGWLSLFDLFQIVFKAKIRRRLVMGLREVTKHLKVKKLKCVIISPNLEKIQSKGMK